MSELPDAISRPPDRIRADLALLSVSIIWGSAFVAQRIAAPNSSAFLFNGLRFLLAAMVLYPIVWMRTHGQSPSRLSRSDWTGIFIAGLLLAGGAAFQQAGLRYTTAGNAGFITGLYVILIPMIQAAVLKQQVRPAIWVAAWLASIGLFLISTGGQLAIKIGDILELAGALFWALHVIWIGRIARQMSGLQLAAGQYLVCGLVSTSLGLIVETNQIYNIQTTAWAIVYTGIISVCLGYTLQIYGQKTAPPADAAILLSLEAVFAAIFGWLFLREVLSATQILGCCVMFAGMLLAQASSQRGKSRISEVG